MSKEIEKEDIENAPPTEELKVLKEISSVEEQQDLKETASSDGVQDVLKVTVSSDGEQGVLKETPSSDEEQGVLKETVSSDREQDVLKETSPSDGEQGVLKETQSVDGEQDFLKEIPSEDGKQKDLKETFTSIEEQKDIKDTSTPIVKQEDLTETSTDIEEQENFEETSTPDEEQEDLKETSTPVEEQLLKRSLLSDTDLEDLKNNPPYEGEVDVLLKESEIKKEPVEIPEIVQSVDIDYPIIVISSGEENSDTDSDTDSEPICISPCYTISNIEYPDNVDDELDDVPKRSLSAPPSNADYSSVWERRCVSLPKDTRLLKEPIDYIIISDDDSDSSLTNDIKPSLKRKRSLNIPSYIEVENTRKTMKPGPKSKTRNIATVHQMITKAKLLGVGPSMDLYDTSDSEISSDEDESDISIISIGSSTDDETDKVEPMVTDYIYDCETISLSDDDEKENSINGENKIIESKSSAALDDKMDETDQLENEIDLNKIQEEENVENKESKNIEIHPNQIIEEKN